MGRIWTAIAALFALGGCATAGPLSLTCRNFDSFRTLLPASALEQRIHGVFGTLPADPIEQRLQGQAAASADAGIAAAAAPEEAVLLLSGGGQWGAFGAGFLAALDQAGRLPRTPTITGVSTGAVQALFVAAAAADPPPEPGRNRATYERLLAAYAPARESDVVKRRPEILAAITGAIAGLKPLKRRLDQALCDDLARPCMIDRLRGIDAGDQVLIGFVEAATGDFYYADALRIARELPKADARDCLTGVALASAAMPVFFQQVRINGRTYYDGGVRQSVFEARIAAAVERAAAAEAERRSLAAPGSAAAAGVPILPIYVIRNGPTRIPPGDPAKGPDAKADALTAAEQAEAIIVNQLEVGSLAALRLEHTRSPIHLVTADGWGPVPGGAGCAKPDKVMFDPAFMACLTRFGAAKGAAAAWIELPSLDEEMRRRR